MSKIGIPIFPAALFTLTLYDALLNFSRFFFYRKLRSYVPCYSLCGISWTRLRARSTRRWKRRTRQGTIHLTSNKIHLLLFALIFTIFFLVTFLLLSLLPLKTSSSHSLSSSYLLCSLLRYNREMAAFTAGASESNKKKKKDE